MHFAWESSVASFIITLVIIFGIYGLFFFVFSKVAKRKYCFITLGASCLTVLITYLFCLDMAFNICAFFSSAIIAVELFANIGDLRQFIANPFHVSTAKATNFGVEKIYDPKALYKNIEVTVKRLSEKRIGAIMTFEKNTSLKDIIKNGVAINAPVSPELLETIFYTGTRLHDGAVVIHGKDIIAASVFFTPTTKPFAGKYGSRHRAAIGISEICDAITVVVSEETGRISLAVNGSLETVDQANFLRVFENYMSQGEDSED